MHRLSILPAAARTRSISIAAAAAATDSSNKDDDHVNGQDPPAENGILIISSNISTELPLYEPPGVSFDEYINDRARVFRAMCPDEYRIQRLNDAEWRIQTQTMHFLFASVSLVIVMRLRCKSSAVPPILESQATRWELQGLQGIEMPSRFTLSWHGTLHAERGGGGSHVKGQLEMSISLALPPVLDLVPKDILRAMIESVLKRFLQNMKHKADASLVSDFEKYRREQLMKHGRASQHPEPVPELDGDS